jgi:hypothetical protein
MLTTNLGMDKMHSAMAVYVKSLSKRAEGADKEKQLPGGHLGSSMVTHGEDFEPDSEFGNCLSCTFPDQFTRLHCINHQQHLDEQTNVWREYRRRMSQVLRHHGLRASSAL